MGRRALLVVAGLCLNAQAQVVVTPPVVPTPSELAPRERPQPLPDLAPRPEPRVPRELGKPEEELTLDVRGYAVAQDAPAALKAALAAITAPYVGPQRSYEDLANAAREVTYFMQRELGYYLGYAFIPEQDPAGGVVRIAVLEGRLDRVVLNWSDGLPVEREVVQAYLDKLRPGDILTVRDVERVVFLVNDLRGITVRAEVTPGSRPGTAQLVFTPQADARVTGKADFDANGSRFIGQHRYGASATVNSPTGRGDGLTAAMLQSTTGELRFGLLGYSTPLGNDGLRTGLSLSHTEYRLNATAFPLGLYGRSDAANVFGLYPVVRSRNLNVFTLLAFDRKRYTDIAATLRTDKAVNALTAGVSGDFRDAVLGGGINTFALSLSAGEVKYADETRTAGLDDAPRYRKLNFSYSRLQNLATGRLLGYVALSGQYALHNLDSTEQFRAGGPDTVRAFAPGEGTGDSGMVLTTELRLLPPQSWFGKYSQELVFATLLDAAVVQARHDPDQVTRAADFRNRRTYSGAGFSATWQSSSRLLARASVAWPLHGTPLGDTVRRVPRVYFQTSLLF